MKTKEEKLDYLNTYLLKEHKREYDSSISFEEKTRLYKTLVNIRLPKEVSNAYLEVQNAYLQELQKEKGILDSSTFEEVEPNLSLFLGDITRLQVDVIVNPGNREGLGCFNPNHLCLDNVIHTSSGLQLRNECQQKLNGKLLSVGEILVCDAYNLPSKKIITTVGPHILKTVREIDKEGLRMCYKNCIEYAIQNHYHTIAFPSISTGLYRFPIKEAKHIAYETIKPYTNSIKVIFDLFSESDYNEYRELFKSKRTNENK